MSSVKNPIIKLFGEEKGLKVYREVSFVAGFVTSLISHRPRSFPLQKHFIFHHIDFLAVEIALWFCGHYP